MMSKFDHIVNEFCKEVGLRVYALRTERNLTREEFAEMVDISSKYVYEIEKGSKNFSIGILYKMCKALDITSSIIMDDEIDVNQLILNELIGKFTDEDKERIKEIVITELFKK